LSDINLGIFINAILALMAGLVTNNLEIGLVLFISGSVGALILWKADRSIYFAYSGLAVAGTQLIIAFLYHLLRQPLDFGQFMLVLLYSALNGLISASLAFFFFSVLGRFFGVTTVMHLMELSHPTQPLLSRLSREAPGTYHHSMLVGTLAEQAAERLEGDSLLARVGAYYHDIGKLAKPANFIDNQGGGPNIHDTLDPRESAKIIRAHVSDGVTLGKKNHLPVKVVDIIEQHHGTCLISFFYQKALSMGLDVSELDFRYPGPKPQTKVAALVMLADASEAAVRANVQSGRIPTGSHAPNPSGKFITIADVVNKIVDDRTKDGQLDESDLTLRDIQMVRRVYVEILTGIYHPRIDYPDTAKKPETNIQVVNVPAVEIPPEAISAAVPVQSLTVVEQEPLLPPSSLPAADAGGDLPPEPMLKELDTDKMPKPEIALVEDTTKLKDEPKPAEEAKLNQPKPGGIGGAGRKINPDVINGGEKK
jgi:cyclic-di-AMP phosphodiesterase PgpH